MKILMYCLPINESFYIKYNVNGLRKLGHDVVSTLEYSNEEYKNFNDPKYLDTFDLVIYGGFSFGNMTGHQMLQYSPAINTKTTVIVTYYDNPERYMNVLLDHAQRKSNFYIACCDNTLTQRLKNIGFKTIFNPCCYDPEIQYKRDYIDEYNVDIAFAGTVLSSERINALYQGKNYREVEILQTMINLRSEGRFFDYGKFLKKYVPLPSKDFGELAFVNLMTQKALLRFDIFKAVKDAGYDVNVWGQGDYKSNDNIISHGNLNQHNELPNMYSNAKINLSVELLPSSVHQRVFECYACGGFMLLEDKKDNVINFSEKLIEKVVWRTSEELSDKIKYYLEHEDERNKITEEFMSDVLVKHTNAVRMEQLISNIQRSKNE